MKLPAFQFYPADWRKDPAIQALSYHDRGIVFETLCVMHESSDRGRLLINGKKMSIDVHARLLGLDKQILGTALTSILEVGALKLDIDGVLFSSRMVKDEAIRKMRQEAGQKGGNPSLLKRKLKQKVNHSPKQTGEEEEEDEVMSSSGKGCGENQDFEIEPPPGFPANEHDAAAHAGFVGCPDSFAIEVWNESKGAGYRDRQNRIIQGFRNTLSSAWNRKQEWERRQARTTAHVAATKPQSTLPKPKAKVL